MITTNIDCYIMKLLIGENSEGHLYWPIYECSTYEGTLGMLRVEAPIVYFPWGAFRIAYDRVSKLYWVFR